MATESELRATLAKYTAARDRILANGATVTVDGTQYTEATFFRLEDTIAQLEQRISMARRGGGFARSGARFGG